MSWEDFGAVLLLKLLALTRCQSDDLSGGSIHGGKLGRHVLFFGIQLIVLPLLRGRIGSYLWEHHLRLQRVLGIPNSVPAGVDRAEQCSLRFAQRIMQMQLLRLKSRRKVKTDGHSYILWSGNTS